MAGTFVVASLSLDMDSMACLCLSSARSQDPEIKDFTLTILRCRQLIFGLPGELVALPKPKDCRVFVVSLRDYFCLVIILLPGLS